MGKFGKGYRRSGILRRVLRRRFRVSRRGVARGWLEESGTIRGDLTLEAARARRGGSEPQARLVDRVVGPSGEDSLYG